MNDYIVSNTRITNNSIYPIPEILVVVFNTRSSVHKSPLSMLIHLCGFMPKSTDCLFDIKERGYNPLELK